MSTTFLVELPDGSFVEKEREDLELDDMIVFDGPRAFREVEQAVSELDAKIEAAGGLEAWRRAG